tara:strand:+ start:1831 stop:2631 length:801 start_codon:yes stop_codon:yes gene_type:complete
MIIKWPGGKKWIPLKHNSLFPDQYNTYLEPFMGSGAVFFGLEPKSALLSDINPKLINLFHELKENPLKLFKETQSLISSHSSEQYYEIRNKFNTSEPTAVNFLYLNRTCFNGVYRENRKGEFNVPVGKRNSSFFPFSFEEFKVFSDALKNAELSCEDCFSALDKAEKDDFIYVDPPYIKNENNYESFRKYGKDVFDRESLEKLSSRLEELSSKCKILISNFDLEDVKILFNSNWNVKSVEQMSYISGNSKGRKAMKEILIHNYEII